MQENLEKTFLGFKFQKIFLSPCTLTSATVTPCNILFQYFTESLRKVLFQKMPPHGKILKKGPASPCSYMRPCRGMDHAPEGTLIFRVSERSFNATDPSLDRGVETLSRAWNSTGLSIQLLKPE